MDASLQSASAADPNEQWHLAAQRFDASLHAAAARGFGGLSPISIALAGLDWGLHLATQPAEASRLALRAQQRAFELLLESGRTDTRPSEDARFAAPAWQQWPWPAVVHAYEAAADWWREATTLRGMTPHDREEVGFFARQWLDMLSPSNLGLLNPEVAQRTREQAGHNLAEGWLNALDRWREQQGLQRLRPLPRPYRPGQDVAVTPGRVVHRNRLVELIQYAPGTPTVAAEPVFIVPSWIMKYYILDLSPENSLVRWLVAQGHTVFILSWRNPDAADALLDMTDYLQLGVFDPLAALARLVPGERVHACGYCLGGTLLAIAAAALARPQKVERAQLLAPLASVSLLAAETDFTEPGEMGVLIDESQVTLIEDMMAEQGYLSGRQMAGSFIYLHSRDLVWSQRLRELWLGEAEHPNDLMAWNADTTRMPAAMHSEYLRRCYLRNEIAEGRYPVEGRPVALSDMRWPMFVVGTERDHVSPWKSVYKIHRLADCEIRFVLTSGGHNAGIVSEPGHPDRHYRMATRRADGPWLDPEAWAAAAPRFEGSWWPAWQAWLQAQGSGRRVKARVPDDTLPAAPGEHVMQRWFD